MPVVAVLSATYCPAIHAQQFINDLGDVPLMAGMHVDTSSHLLFETASGRVVELRAQVPSWAEAQAFYRETLPSLGWQEIAEMHFVREAESLQLHQITAQSMRLHLAPRQ